MTAAADPAGRGFAGHPPLLCLDDPYGWAHRSRSRTSSCYEKSSTAANILKRSSSGASAYNLIVAWKLRVRVARLSRSQLGQLPGADCSDLAASSPDERILAMVTVMCFYGGMRFGPLEFRHGHPAEPGPCPRLSAPWPGTAPHLGLAGRAPTGRVRHNDSPRASECGSVVG